MHGDTLIPLYTLIIFSILIMGMLLKTISIPYVVSYLFVGILLGPNGIGFVQDTLLLKQFEMVGLVFLLFFVGMEISLKELLKNWKIPIVGTFIQIAVTVGIIFLLGSFLDWKFIRVILIGFVISISSTAVVIKLLNESNQNNTHVGRNVIGVLLVQDIALIPMIIVLDLMQGQSMPIKDLVLQFVGGILMVILIIYLLRKKEIHLPFRSYFQGHKELQIFLALAICFGMVMGTELFRLSPFLGAFMAGIYVRTARETDWIHITLEPFFIFFVAIFFVSVGMMLDLNFVFENWGIILLLVSLVFILNTAVNTSVMRMLGEPWRESLLGGAMLAQVGEFSFVILSVGGQAGIVSEYTYQTILALITLTLMLSPAWIALFKKLIRIS
ncbi:MAG TPA: cation:proton antiporter [Bacteroides sp.]|nr:cation:proton antiporter [Bacteroides sp.]